jgi:hypothetical protein
MPKEISRMTLGELITYNIAKHRVLWLNPTRPPCYNEGLNIQLGELTHWTSIPTITVITATIAGMTMELDEIDKRE